MGFAVLLLAVAHGATPLPGGAGPVYSRATALENEVEDFLKHHLCPVLQADASLAVSYLRDPIAATDLASATSEEFASAAYRAEEVRFSGPPAATSAALFGRRFEHYLAPLAVRTRCSTVFHRFVPSAADGTGNVSFHLLLAGIAPDGSRLLDAGDVQATVAPGPGNGLGRWRVARIEFGQRHRVRATYARFTNVTREAGLPLDFAEPRVATAATDGLDRGGLAVADVDGDGDLDLYIAADGPNQMFLNRGDGGFEEAAGRLGLADPGNGRAALFADFDGDGDVDLALTNKSRGRLRSEVVVYRNDGGHFQRAFIQTAPGARQYVVLASADVDGDGDLDLFVGGYAAPWSTIQDLIAHRSTAPDLLLVNDGGLKFAERAREWWLPDAGRTVAAALVDLDADGRPELVLADDFGRKRIYHNQAGERFADVSERSGLAADRANGSAIDVADVDGDGALDLYFGNIHSNAASRLVGGMADASAAVRERVLRSESGNTLWLGGADLRFREAGVAQGVASGGWAYGVTVFDTDDDGVEDAFSPCGYYSAPLDNGY